MNMYLVAKDIRAGYNQYAPMQGVGAQRETISEKTRHWKTGSATWACRLSTKPNATDF